MKKTFLVTLETDTGFPDDLYGASDWQEHIQESADQLNWVFPDTPKVNVTVEEIE